MCCYGGRKRDVSLKAERPCNRPGTHRCDLRRFYAPAARVQTNLRAKRQRERERERDLASCSSSREKRALHVISGRVRFPGERGSSRNASRFSLFFSLASYLTVLKPGQLMNEVTLRNPDAHIRATLDTTSVYIDLRSGRAVSRRGLCMWSTERERERGFFIQW